MPSYIGRHADLYDLFYKNKNYKAEAKFVHGLISDYSSRKTRTILELAGGTGNHSFHLSQYGYMITLTDNSHDMLRVARKKLSVNTNVEVDYMDMTRFKKFNKQFDTVICLFDSIGYVQTNDNILRVLKNVSTCLKKKGLFIFEYWNAGAMISSFDPVRLKEWRDGGRKVVRRSETKLFYENQLCKVHYTITEYEGDRIKRKIRESQTNRFFLSQEMNLFLSSTGLRPLALFDGFTRRKKITEKSWHTVCVAGKI